MQGAAIAGGGVEPAPRMRSCYLNMHHDTPLWLLGCAERRKSRVESGRRVKVLREEV